MFDFPRRLNSICMTEQVWGLRQEANARNDTTTVQEKSTVLAQDCVCATIQWSILTPTVRRKVLSAPCTLNSCFIYCGSDTQNILAFISAWSLDPWVPGPWVPRPWSLCSPVPGSQVLGPCVPRSLGPLFIVTRKLRCSN